MEEYQDRHAEKRERKQGKLKTGMRTTGRGLMRSGWEHAAEGIIAVDRKRRKQSHHKRRKEQDDY